MAGGIGAVMVEKMLPGREPVKDPGARLGGPLLPLHSVCEGGVSVQPAVGAVTLGFVLSILLLLPLGEECDRDGVVCFLPMQPVCLGLGMLPSTVFLLFSGLW